MELPTQTGKRKREEAEEKETERCNNYWCHLPPNFICSLLYYVSPKTACALKATCKAWNRARLLLPVPIGSPSSPCHSSPAVMITYKHKKKGTDTLDFKFVHPMNRESFHVRFERDQYHYLKNARVRYSNFGWLLMEQYTKGTTFLFFFNPFTKRKIQLPPFYTFLDRMCFTSPPTSPDCQVLGWWWEGEKTALLKLSDKTWRVYEYSLQHYSMRKLWRHYCSPVFYRGSWYQFCRYGSIVVCHLRNDCALTIHDTKLSSSTHRAVVNGLLLEVDGKLLGVFYQWETEQFVVRWLDIERWEWHPVQLSDLRDKILYLSSERSFVQCDDTTKGKGNRIYVLGFAGNLKHYSLETDKYLDVDKEFLSYQHLFTHVTWITPADCCSC